MPGKKVAIDNELPDSEDLGEIDPRVYNQVARCAKIVSVQLIESNFHILPDFFQLDESIVLNINFCDVYSSFNDETRFTSTMFEFEAFKKGGRRKLFTIKSNFVVYYYIPSDCDSTHATAFSRKTGLLAAYPYFRSHVANICAMANANVPILPTISSMPVKEKIKKEAV